MKYPSIAELRNRLRYCPDTGKLFWKTAHRKKKAGDEAGYMHPYGYVVVGINGSIFGAHRVAFAIHYGKWPELFVDHINGDRADNRISNLREASHRVNAQNRSKPREGKKIPLLGVSQHPRCKNFSANINVNGKTLWLGSYKTAEQAHEAYMQAKAKYHEGNGAYAPMEELIAQRAA